MASIQTVLDDDDLPPHTANRLAGRLNFITQSTFGALGEGGTAAHLRQGP